MPGSTIGINMNYGFPGQASRHGDEVSRTRPIKAGTGNVKFGAPVIQNDDVAFIIGEVQDIRKCFKV